MSTRNAICNPFRRIYELKGVFIKKKDWITKSGFGHHWRGGTKKYDSKSHYTF